MRIGEFSKRFDIPTSTIRYYIQLGLLITEKRNGQHLFNELCVKDMTQIMEWKRLRFSLEDIHELLTFRRKYIYPQNEDMESYLKLFLNQQCMIIQKKNEVQKQLSKINTLLKEISIRP